MQMAFILLLMREALLSAAAAEQQHIVCDLCDMPVHMKMWERQLRSVWKESLENKDKNE